MNRSQRAGQLAFAICTGLCLHVPALLQCQDRLVDLDSFRDGCQALEDGRFETAIRSLELAWEHLDATGAGELERDFVASRLLESRVRNDETEAAVAWLEKHPPTNPSTDTLRWAAFAYQREKRYAKAAQTYGELAGGIGTLSRPLKIHHAVCLALSQNEEVALAIISDLGAPESPLEALQFAQISNSAGELTAALTYLSTPSPVAGENTSLLSKNRAIHFSGIGLKTAILKELGQTDINLSEILRLIENAPDEQEAHRAFLLLENALQENSPVKMGELAQTWVDKKSHPAQLPAKLFTLISLPDSTERTEKLLQWKTEHPESATAAEALLRVEKKSSTAEDMEFPPSSTLLPGGKERIAFEEAMASYRAERYSEAADKFLSSISEDKGEFRSRNRYNAAISLLRKNEFEAFLKIFQELQSEAPNSLFLADLNYIAGLFLASSGDPRSIDFLQPFVRENPNHPAHIEALLALAEIHLNQAPARPQAASEIFDGLRTRPLTLEQSERLDYTAVWLEVIQHNSTGIVASATEFRKNWPGSVYLPEVTMLLAKRQLQDNRLSKALELLDEIAKHSPDSRFAAQAVFLAAKSSSAGPEAIARWLEIADAEGEYALQARHELALLYLSLDRFGESRNELKKVIESSPAKSPLAFAARADYAFSYYAEALASGHDPELLETSAAEFASLSNVAEAPEAVRYSAAVRRGRCLEALKNDPVALEIYQSIVGEPTSETLSPIQEIDRKSTEWIFRAGFSAIEILSKNENWKEAIQVADALSRKDGPRAIEASQLAEQMRLKHWVWE
jgi:tetratricopeptide (TPR) repeat protein